MAKKSVSLGDCRVILLSEENENESSDLARGLNAAVLCDFLAELESAAKLSNGSSRQNPPLPPLYQNCRKSAIKHYTLVSSIPPIQLCGSMVKIGVLLSASLKLKFGHDSVANLVIVILFHLICTARYLK